MFGMTEIKTIQLSSKCFYSTDCWWVKCDIENRKYKKRSWGKQEKRWWMRGGAARRREQDKRLLSDSQAEKLLRNQETNISIFGEEVMRVQYSYFPLFFWQILFYWASLKEPSCWPFLKEYFLWHQCFRWEMKSALNWWTGTLTCLCKYLCVWESLCAWVLQFALDTH